ALFREAARLFACVGFVGFVPEERPPRRRLEKKKETPRKKKKGEEGHPEEEGKAPPPPPPPPPPQHDERSAHGHRRGRQSDALRRRHPLSDGQHGRSNRSGQRQKLPGSAHPRPGHRTPGPHHRKSAPGAGALQIRRRRPEESTDPVPRRGRDFGLHFQPHEREAAGINTATP